MYGSNREKAFAQIMLDSRDETMMLVQACSVINCANVQTADVNAQRGAVSRSRLSGYL
jgi:hypothetical protein